MARLVSRKGLRHRHKHSVNSELAPTCYQTRLNVSAGRACSAYRLALELAGYRQTQEACRDVNHCAARPIEVSHFF